MGVNVVTFGGQKIVDLRDATATPESILSGYTAYGADGNKIIGTASATKRLEVTVRLPPAAWDSDGEQTVTVAGVTATATVIVTGSEASQPEYDACAVVCSGQGAGTLTFSCGIRPGEELAADIAIFT